MSSYIYESPDGGITVYRRKSGSNKREMIQGMQKISIATFFDITATGVKNYRRDSDSEVGFQRNQQRNWETILQVISLRCQPLNIQGPYVYTDETSGYLYWTFTFENDRPDVFQLGDDSLGALKEDLHLVPMLVGLTETKKDLFLTPYITTRGDLSNTAVSEYSAK